MMILMKKRRVIAYIKRSWNLFILKFAALGKAMTIKRRGWPLHLVNQNKCIRIWHYRLAHARNTRIINAAKLMDRINLNNYTNKKYDPLIQVLTNSDNSDVKVREPDFDTSWHLSPVIASVSLHSSTIPFIDTCQIESSNVEKLYAPYVRSKSTQVIK